jgi:pimeloyl-ACP methyl ester carboxylesterase
LPEQPFTVNIPGGSLAGHDGGSGPPALLLHGGAAVPDYLDGLAVELSGLFTTYRYTQRGTPPSAGGPPFTIEAHMEDGLAVLDAFGIERAWAVGHSWGGHLALHLLVAHPDRLLGVVCVDPLPASPDVFVEMRANLRSGLSADEVARLDALERRRRTGEITEDELIERFELVWPHYFYVPGCALPPPSHIGVQASIGTNRSLDEHFERRTLLDHLPAAKLPTLFVHGEQSVVPLYASAATCALVPGGEFVAVPECGHFLWIERPGCVRDAVERFLAR